MIGSGITNMSAPPLMDSGCGGHYHEGNRLVENNLERPTIGRSPHVGATTAMAQRLLPVTSNSSLRSISKAGPRVRSQKGPGTNSAHSFPTSEISPGRGWDGARKKPKLCTVSCRDARAAQQDPPWPASFHTTMADSHP